MTETVRQGQPVASQLDFDLAHEFVGIVLGMDILYRSADSTANEVALDKEGLVPINLTDVCPKSHSGWADVQVELNALRQKYMQVPDEVRRNYMQQQIGSVSALAAWASGEPISLRDRVRKLLYVNENPMTEAEMRNLHEQLDRALAVRGYGGALAQKVERWRTVRLVPTREIETALRELLLQARSRVVDRMFPEIADVEMTPVVVHSVPYSAYCDYVGRKMYINGDLGYTYEALKHLVCHEAFPGHSTHMRMRELGVRNGSIPVDAGLVITNTASSSVFEGIGDNGMNFIDWETSEDDKIHHQFQLLRSIAGANAVHMIHEQDVADDRVGAYLEWACFADEPYIQSRLRFFKHNLRAPFIFSYWRGYEAVRDAYSRVAKDDRARFFAFLYQSMLSADTVRQFE